MAIQSRFAGIATLHTKIESGLNQTTAVRVVQSTKYKFKVEILEASSLFEAGQITVVPRGAVTFSSEDDIDIHNEILSSDSGVGIFLTFGDRMAIA